MPQTVKRTVTVKLSEAEVLHKADQLVAAVTEHSSVDEERKAVSKSFRERMGTIEEHRDAIAKTIADRAEEREVDVIPEPDYREGLMLYRRVDTGEIVDRRELDPDELQTTIDSRTNVVADIAAADKGKSKGKKGGKRGRPPKLRSVPPPGDSDAPAAAAANGAYDGAWTEGDPTPPPGDDDAPPDVDPAV